MDSPVKINMSNTVVFLSGGVFCTKSFAVCEIGEEREKAD